MSALKEYGAATFTFYVVMWQDQSSVYESRWFPSYNKARKYIADHGRSGADITVIQTKHRKLINLMCDLLSMKSLGDSNMIESVMTMTGGDTLADRAFRVVTTPSMLAKFGEGIES